MDLADSNILKRRFTTMLSSRSFNEKETIKLGMVPQPRDGHSANVYEDKMIIFGGDRNKFPFNDLYAFSSI